MGVQQLELAALQQEFATAAIFASDRLAVYTLQSVELEREIIGLFLIQISDVVDKLKKTRDYGEWKLIVHTLKGAALAIGALQLAEVAKVLEEPEIYENQPLRLELIQYLALAVSAFQRQMNRLYP